MTIGMRPFLEQDIPALEQAISKDTFHPGEWKVEHFYDKTPDLTKYHPPVSSHVIEDSQGPVVYVRFTKTLRISVVWNDGEDNSRNARAIIFGLREAVKKARASGFSEIIIQTNHPKMAAFLTSVMKLTHSGDEYLLAV